VSRNRLRGMSCYLSGPMDRVDFADAKGWREWIKPRLWARGVGVFDPCDKPLVGVVEDPELHSKVDEWKRQGEWDKVRAAYKPIVGVDLRMVDITSFTISLIDIDSHMCGTYDEDFLAASQRKPILCMVKQGKQKAPNWLFGRIPHEHIFSSWEDLEGYLDHIAYDDEVDHLRRWTFFDFNKVWGPNAVH